MTNDRLFLKFGRPISMFVNFRQFPPNAAGLCEVCIATQRCYGRTRDVDNRPSKRRSKLLERKVQ